MSWFKFLLFVSTPAHYELLTSAQLIDVFLVHKELHIHDTMFFLFCKTFKGQGNHSCMKVTRTHRHCFKVLNRDHGVGIFPYNQTTAIIK
jgi:hypothetical protein